MDGCLHIVGYIIYLKKKPIIAQMLPTSSIKFHSGLVNTYLNQVKKYILYIWVKSRVASFPCCFFSFGWFFSLLSQLTESSEKQRKGVVGTEMNKEKKKEREKERRGKKEKKEMKKKRGELDTASYHCSLSLAHSFRNDDYMIYIFLALHAPLKFIR